MNAILAVVIIAACASAQSTRTIDLNNLLRRQSTDSTVSDVLRSAGLFGRHFNNRRVGDVVPSVYDDYLTPRSTYNYNDYVNRYDYDTTTTIYSLDELVRLPVFRQYLALPYFRQYISHPLFQYYLTTPLFQRYFRIPQFQTFFQNPILFYTYVYPVVFNTEYNYDSVYPSTSSSSSVSSVIDRYLNQVPVVGVDSIYNNRYSNIFGRQQQSSSVLNRYEIPYRYVLERLYRDYFVNRPITEVITDVRVQQGSQVDDATLGRYVDPITQDVRYTTGDYRTVQDRIVPNSIVDQISGVDQVGVQDAVLRRLLNRQVVGDRQVDSLTQNSIPILDRLNKIHRFDSIVNSIVPQTTNRLDELTRTPVVGSELPTTKTV